MDALAILKEVSSRDGVNGRIAESLNDAVSLLGQDAGLLDDQIFESFSDAPGGVLEPCRHIVEAGGKRIRPMVCLLVFKAAGGVAPLPTDLAVICELLHNATLLHDDVIDEGEFRRGRPATRVIHGNALSVLGGDYLLVKTVEMVSKRGGSFMNFLVKTLKCLINGELSQLKRRGSVETTEEEYFSIVEGKTASLFRWAAYSGALAAGADEKACLELGEFGWHMGVAFQLVDDILDFTADPSVLGKNLLADISEGKMTLPVILACKKVPSMKRLLGDLSNGGNVVVLAPKVADLVHSTGAVEEAKKQASEHTRTALDTLLRLPGLRPNPVAILEQLSRALLEREF